MVIKQPWEARAAAKRASIAAKIPSDWRLSERDLKKAEDRRNLTGSFIEQYLTDHERMITGLSAVSLLSKIRDKDLTALEVTSAFCKRTAIAQQMVYEISFVVAQLTLLRSDYCVTN